MKKEFSAGTNTQSGTEADNSTSASVEASPMLSAVLLSVTAGTEADSITTAQNQQVSQPNANTNVGRSVGEYILCAAIWYKNDKKYVHQPKNIESGYVMCGRRHHNVITLHHDLTGLQTKSEGIEQGFITNTDRFVGRCEAGQIAFKAGQITWCKEKPITEPLISEELYSEDLY